MPKGSPLQSSRFSGRPRALRRELIALLDRVDHASVQELAGFAYSGRVCRLRPPSCSKSQVDYTRIALSALVAKGRVVIVGRHRRRRLYALADRPAFPPLELGPLG